MPACRCYLVHDGRGRDGVDHPDFRRIVRRPGIVMAAITGQLIVLPVIGWLLVRCPGLQPALARGVLLVAASPGGARANACTHLGRGNVALSVLVGAVSCLADVLSTPLVLAVFAT